MTSETLSTTVFAPAKINLYLHVTGRRDNGYHELDSLIAFADIGDEIHISPSPDFQFEVEGPFAKGFNAKERDASPHSSNLVVRAAWAMMRLYKKPANFKVKLVKNLPMGAGIGGGSSDAAALIWGLLDLWQIPPDMKALTPIMMGLGADVPVCLRCQTSRILGAGEHIEEGSKFDECPVVMIYPGKPCHTKDVFKHFGGSFQSPLALPAEFNSFDKMIAFLRKTQNSLSLPANDHVPEIENILNTLKATEGCVLPRMTGSGSSCFGLFEDAEMADKAVQEISANNPDWWVKMAWLGRPERY